MYKMLVDYNEHIRKGDAPPPGLEAKFVKAGLAEVVPDLVFEAVEQEETDLKLHDGKAKK